MPEPSSTPPLPGPIPRQLSTVLAMLAFGLVIAALHFGRDIFVPLALAALLGFVLDPLVCRLHRWRWPRWLAVGMVVSVTVGVLGGTAFFLGSQLVGLGREVPAYQSTMQSKLRELRETLARKGVLSEASRLFGMVEGELDATRRALDRPAAGAVKAPMRVHLEPGPAGSLQALGDTLAPLLAPLLMIGLVLVFLVFILLGRNDLRDRVVRLSGGELHRMSDALEEAAQRVGRYLGAQLLVNLAYGLPLAAGLWMIGVPGALLWGLLASALRFVPYIGPAIAAVFPLSVAFAVEPGWSLLLWTLALVVALELVVNNLVEPLAYGSSTGLSPLAVLLSATFWTVVWGPIGLILATPITVCLVVLGRHLRPLRIFDLLLGSEPAFDASTTLYQRLLAGDVEDAIELACDRLRADSSAVFYIETALPALILTEATPGVDRRAQVAAGMRVLLRDLEDENGPSSARATLLCIGGQSVLDSLAAEMLSRALAAQELNSTVQPLADGGPATIDALDLAGIDIVIVSCLAQAWTTPARNVCRRLRRRNPAIKIIVLAWRRRQVNEAKAAAVGADAVVGSFDLLLQQLHAHRRGHAPASESEARGEPIATALPEATV
jgi:predicted PurR-regulated permease PerM/CheY-like chemotaxis protein